MLAVNTQIEVSLHATLAHSYSHRKKYFYVAVGSYWCNYDDGWYMQAKKIKDDDWRICGCIT